MKKAEEKKEKARFHQRKRAETRKVEFDTEEDTQKLQPRKKVSKWHSIYIILTFFLSKMAKKVSRLII